MSVKTVDEQKCLQLVSEWNERRNSSKRWWQTVPCTRCSDGESTITQGRSLHQRNDKHCCCGRPQMTAAFHVGCQTNVVCNQLACSYFCSVPQKQSTSKLANTSAKIWYFQLIKQPSFACSGWCTVVVISHYLISSM